MTTATATQQSQGQQPMRHNGGGAMFHSTGIASVLVGARQLLIKPITTPLFCCTPYSPPDPPDLKPSNPLTSALNLNIPAENVIKTWSLLKERLRRFVGGVHRAIVSSATCHTWIAALPAALPKSSSQHSIPAEADRDDKALVQYQPANLAQESDEEISSSSSSSSTATEEHSSGQSTTWRSPSFDERMLYFHDASFFGQSDLVFSSSLNHGLCSLASDDSIEDPVDFAFDMSELCDLTNDTQYGFTDLAELATCVGVVEEEIVVTVEATPVTSTPAIPQISEFGGMTEVGQVDPWAGLETTTMDTWDLFAEDDAAVFAVVLPANDNRWAAPIAEDEDEEVWVGENPEEPQTALPRKFPKRSTDPTVIRLPGMSGKINIKKAKATKSTTAQRHQPTKKNVAPKEEKPNEVNEVTRLPLRKAKIQPRPQQAIDCYHHPYLASYPSTAFFSASASLESHDAPVEKHTPRLLYPPNRNFHHWFTPQSVCYPISAPFASGQGPQRYHPPTVPWRSDPFYVS